MTISPIWRPLRQPEALNDEGSRWAALLGWGYRYSVRQTDDHGTDFRMTETADMVKAQVALLAVLFDGQILNAFLCSRSIALASITYPSRNSSFRISLC